MTTQPIVSALDISRLQPFIAGNHYDIPAMRLHALFEKAKRVEPRRMPPDVVTMNSRVLVRYSGEAEPDTFELAYPDSSEDGAGGLSVISPLGAALLGAREGEVVECAGGRTSRLVTVERIEYQPERERHYDR